MVVNRRVKTMNIAIIPARSGSKRIPKKNIVEFNGKPMIAWTIEAALNSNMFSKILVSTDCEEIQKPPFLGIFGDQSQILTVFGQKNQC